MRSALLNIAFARPQYFEQVLDGLRAQEWNRKYDYYCFIDGPRTINDRAAIDENVYLAKQFIKDMEGKIYSSSIILRSKNMGCDDNISDAIIRLLLERKYDELIVVEEDVLPMKGFIPWVEWGLDNIVGNNMETCCTKRTIFNIIGFSEPKSTKEDPKAYRINRWFTPWGWATKRDVWLKYFGEYAVDVAFKGLHETQKNLVEDYPIKNKSKFVQYDSTGKVMGYSGGWDNFTNMIGEINNLHEVSPVVPRTRNIGRIGLHQDGDYLWPELVDRLTTSEDYDLVKDGFHEV